ncbi:MAG: STAS domain-containing protein [Nitrospiraceae bacterium]|nr:STAS domain-containing protein [Nitrospiraceae bacterium]
MSKIPILKIEDILIASVQTELHDRMAEDLQHDIMEELGRTNARGVLIDVTALAIVDSFLGRMIGDTAKMTRMMGAKTVLVGLQPAVAITMVELGMELAGIHTALNMEKGIDWLRQNTKNRAMQ